MDETNREETQTVLGQARDATLVILGYVWPKVYMFVENVTNARTYSDRGSAMMFFGECNGQVIQVWKSVKAIEGEEFVERLSAASAFDRNAHLVMEHLRKTHIDKRPRFRRLAMIDVANAFVIKANKRHGPKLSTQPLVDLEEFHQVILEEASKRALFIPYTDHNYPPPNAASTPLQKASQFSIFDLPGLTPP